ncbi:MAG: fumarate hydratase [Candidatus Muirbacterium halophilum]|nr:fumarate hydratase [Candidatus Muirbacterium halophilum]MCK9475473.1 fumarate hydratase [Candidatus Muirbacterium halophilum]
MNLEEKIKNDIYKSVLKSSISLEDNYIDFIKSKINNSQISKERFFLRKIIENSKIAECKEWPLCQDTGFLTFYIKLPKWFQNGYLLKNIIDNSLIKLWKDKGFRNSVIGNNGVNTDNNLPAKYYFDFSNEDKLDISYIIKGGGSENVSLLLTLIPNIEEDEFVEKVSCEILNKANSKACPPYFIGIGKGGSVESSSINARKALIDIDFKNMNNIESKICEKLNLSNIGLFGTKYGDTVFFVKIIEDFSHIANNIVSIAINCHSLRRGKVIYTREYNENS